MKKPCHNKEISSKISLIHFAKYERKLPKNLPRRSFVERHLLYIDYLVTIGDAVSDENEKNGIPMDKFGWFYKVNIFFRYIENIFCKVQKMILMSK
jgi:hypothetical protein